MSDYDDYDYGSGGLASKRRGLTRETVAQIRWAVLGDGGPPEVAPAAPVEPTPAARRNGRFAAGQSGNPKGRPRKAFSPKSVPVPELDRDLLAATVRKVLDREMQVTTNGVTENKQIRDIITEVQVQKAARGSTAAARYLDALDQRGKQIDARKCANHYAIWRDRKARYAEIHARQRKRSSAGISWDCPHPDDIVLGPGHAVKVEGPMTPDELIQTRERYERAQYWRLLATYDGWLQVRRHKAKPDCKHAHASPVSCYLFEAEQQLLPPRLQMARADVEAQIAEWSNLAGRTLHDLLRAEAAFVGLPVPPRALRIPFTLVHPLSEQIVPEAHAPPQQASGARGQSSRSTEDLFRAAWAGLMKEQKDGRRR